MISRGAHGPRLDEVLSCSRAMFTLNSTTGMEALLRGIPVFNLAPAFYERSGMSIPVGRSDAIRVRTLLEANAGSGVDRSAVARFANWLFQECMSPSPLSGIDGGISLADRIRATLPQRDLR